MQANRYFLKATAAAILVSCAGLASAAGSTTLNVTATVSAVCKFKTATMSDIVLGTIDPSTVSAAVTGTSNINYQCTKGTTPTVGITSGGTQLTGGGNTIPYSFTLGTPDAGTGFSAAGASKVVGTASIALTDAQDAAAGSYTDLVTLSINN